ncbi:MULTISPECIES: hypothetical protein [Actinomadura]|uniref:hypothetical protein n=1 Tax=Actinomadura TaxID=1988 RepID=UPI000478AA16|nr:MULTISPECIES: hypothetical protein [Actinomadura]RSN64208.1 hypothetical protein DMH08_18005 [Actinomadura sp. WAC 06369]
MNAGDLTIVAVLAGCAGFAGVVTYLLVGRDLRGGARVAAAVGAAVLVGLASIFVLYLAVAAFLACGAAYLVARRMLRPGLALAASGVVLLGGLSCAVALMSIALSEM